MLTQSTLTNSFPTLTNDQKEELDYLFAEAIHNNGLPFDALTGKEWAKFFNKLNPAYSIPTREKVGSTLLCVFSFLLFSSFIHT